MRLDTTNNIRLFSSRVSPFSRLGSRRLILVVLGIVVVGLLALIIKTVIRGNQTSTSSNQTIQIKDAKVTKNINREFSFALKDEKGEEVTNYKYYIENAELRDQIIVKGQEANAVDGRTFLIINLKVTNNYNKAISINTRDYLRFTIGNNGKELLAADIHNDPVEVQAISTKYTRIGLPIDAKDKNIKLHVGEINGNKTVVDLKL